MNRCTWILSVAVICGAFCTQAQAQLSNSSTSPFGSSGFGSSSGGTSSGGSQSNAATPFSGGVASGMFSNATSALFGAQILGNLNQGGGNQQLGRNQLFGGGGLGNRGSGRGQFNNRNNNRGNRGSGAKSVTVRTILRIGFTPVRPASTKITTNLQKQFDGMKFFAKDSGIKVSAIPAEKKRGSIAVLTGTVSSAHRRIILEKLAMMEPGVVGVENQLIVAPAPILESEIP